MPDLVTHLAGGFLAGRALKIARWVSIFYLGVLLPDLITRPFHILWPPLFPATQPFHSPLILFVLCWFLSLFFRVDQRPRFFCLLYGGCWAHILLDMLQVHLIGGYIWLYPFSSRTFSFGFLRPEAFLGYLWLTIPLILWAFIEAWRKQRKR